MEDKSYTKYVKVQQQRNPCLQNLCEFLEERNEKPCRIVCLDFSSTNQVPKQRTFDVGTLACFLDTANEGENAVSDDHKQKGCILIVEDLNQRIIELLGSNLDIDPLFFASHIDTPASRADSSKPSRMSLPSYSQNLEFLNLHFHQILKFKDEAKGLNRVISEGNIQRKVVVVPASENSYIGLARHCCSMMTTRTKDGKWLGIILVDPPTKTDFYSPEKKISLETELFRGGYEDFLPRGSITDTNKIGPERKSMLEDVVFYWNQRSPPSFNHDSPSLLCLGYYPLRIVVAEWGRYIELLNRTTRNYVYSTDIPAENPSISKLDRDMSLLQHWVRRCTQTLSKLDYVSMFVQTRIAESSTEEKAVFWPIVQDFQHLEKMVTTYNKQLEAKMQVVTSLVQIVDARRSLREAANITRLTNLALLFIPLSFVTSLFGMNDSLSSHQLVLFVSVSIPLCLGVLFVARFPQATWESFVMKMKKEKKTIAKVAV